MNKFSCLFTTERPIQNRIEQDSLFFNFVQGFKLGGKANWTE